MENIFSIKIADLVFKIKSKFDYVKEFCKDFLTDEPSDFFIEATLEELEQEQSLYSVKYPLKYLETTCVYRHIAQLLPLKNRVVMHGVALKYIDSGFLFIAPSGVGKTTHAKLWQEYLGEKVEIINGDKPILEFSDSGIILHSNPWCGKEGIYKKTTAKLKGVCIVSRGENTICQVDLSDSLNSILVQIFMPTKEELADKTLLLLEKFSSVKIYKLKCDISKNAFLTSYNALTGDKYEN